VSDPEDFATETVNIAVAMPVSRDPHSKIGLLPYLSIVQIGGIEPSQLQVDVSASVQETRQKLGRQKYSLDKTGNPAQE
jgi:hypothetical protein